MSFDDDAAGEGAGFRPPPHPDDRLWRHPSELLGGGSAASTPRTRRPLRPGPARPRWPWGVVAAVGTAGVVAVTLGGALVLGLRGQPPATVDGPQVEANTAVVPSPSDPAQRAWLGIEGYDQAAAAEAEATTTASPTSPPVGEEGGTGSTVSVSVTAEVPGGGSPPPVAGEDGAPEPDPDALHDPAPTIPSPDLPQAGVVVAAVDPDGPAADALQPGDVVLEVDGEPVEDMETLLEALQSYRPGDEVEITYKTNRVGEDSSTTTTALVTLAERPARVQP